MTTPDLERRTRQGPHRRTRLRQPGPRACAQSARLRPRCRGRPAQERPLVGEGPAEGFSVAEPGDAVKDADLVAVLTPDMVQPALYRDSIAPNIKPGAALLFAHGFNVHFKQIEPRADIDVILVAPKGPGALVRREYEIGRGVPSIWAVHQDVSGHAEAKAKAYADGIGGGRALLIKTDFKEETETDLFGEQAVLCGGASELVQAGFETLVEAGYQPEIAYYEVTARTEADRGPVLRRRHRPHVGVRLRDRAVRRLRERPARDRRRHQGAHEGRTQGHPGRHLRAQLDRRVPGWPAQLQEVQAGRSRASDRDRSAPSCVRACRGCRRMRRSLLPSR